jgi:hypothetical protein
MALQATLGAALGPQPESEEKVDGRKPTHSAYSVDGWSMQRLSLHSVEPGEYD